MPVVQFEKHPKDAYPFIVEYLNEDGTPYSVDSVDISARNKATGANATEEVTDSEKSSTGGNKASVWVKDGQVGARYEIEVTATMETGEVFCQELLMTIVDN